MKASLRLAGVTLLAGGLGLSGTVLSAGAASADTGLTSAATMSGQHRDYKDDTCNTRHDYTRGHEDTYGRYHPGNDNRHWCDDNGNLRSDEDYNGRWTGRDGCVHDHWGWWNRDGGYNWHNGRDDRDDRGQSKTHNDGHGKSDARADYHKPGKKF